jgi:biotin carboxylase
MNLQSKKSILIFGGGQLQLSIIEKCKNEHLTTIVIDPFENAIGKKYADSFEVIQGDDFDGTCRIIEKYKVDGIITAATDKPLVMMARIAEKYNFPFFSLDTAGKTTDKFKMKEVFQTASLPHSNGKLIKDITSDLTFPAILKPRDNSGSRGVILCDSMVEAQAVLSDVKSCTSLETILYEEFISGKEYSIEAIHTETETFVIQYTEKLTTEFPYNVELGHIAPAQISEGLQLKITQLINEIAKAFNYKYCASHTELKINENNQIYIIETSPRLGGDFITSELVPLSTSFDIERNLIQLSLGNTLSELPNIDKRFVGIFYFNFQPGTVQKIVPFDEALKNTAIIKFELILSVGETIPQIKSSIDRYGFFILTSDNGKSLITEKERLMSKFENIIL